MILPAAYIPASIALDFIPKSWDKRGLIMIGASCCGLSLFLVGPSSLFATQSNLLSLMIVGQALVGFFIPMGLILALPTMVEIAEKKFPEHKTRINNLSAGLFSTSNGLGEVVGPLFGA